MDLDPKIKRLCDEKLKTLFCDKFWIRFWKLNIIRNN